MVPIYFWALPFLAALGFTILIERFCVRWALFDHPGERKMQTVPVPRLGGMAFIVVSLVFCKVLSAVAPWELIAGSLIVYLGGMYDDLRASNSVFNKLAFQIPAALVFA